MKNYLGKILYLIGDDLKKLPLMLLLFIMLSAFELACLSLIIPYISLIINQEVVSNSYFFFEILNKKQLMDKKKVKYCDHIIKNEKNIKILKKKLLGILNTHE